MRKIIVDCDPGMDDSSAIIMAVKNPNLDIQAVTTVNGNYPVDITYRNARRIMRMLGREDIPVYRGCSRPLVRDIPNDPFTHGRDGQGESFLPDSELPENPTHAVNAIIDLIRQQPGEITLVCLAPMTNIAMALRLAPDIKDKIVEVIAISGAFGLNEASFLNATGDTPQSEWNVYVDPEATKQVYESGLQVTAIGLDVATYFVDRRWTKTLRGWRRATSPKQSSSIRRFPSCMGAASKPTARSLTAWRLRRRLTRRCSRACAAALAYRRRTV